MTENIKASVMLSRGLLFTLVWWVLADGAAASWWIGVPAVLAALFASTALLPASTFAWYPALRFVPFFLQRSLLGGADVAWRALHPGMPIAPDIIDYRLRLPPGLPRVFLANTISLLPGTLSAELGETSLKVHVLDARQDFLSEIEVVEQGIAAMFRADLPASSKGE